MISNSVILYILGEKGYFILSALVKAGYAKTIAATVIGRDSGVRNDYHKEIIALCKKEKIIYFDRSKLKGSDLRKNPMAIAIGWRWLINAKKHDKLIIIHDSILPRYRGFAPLVSQLINGETTIGATAIVASEEYDRGDIIFQEKVEISYPIKVQEAIGILSKVYATIILKLLQNVADGKEFLLHEQNEEHATYSVWRDQSDLQINWSWPSQKIERFVNATGFPYSGSFTYVEEKKLLIEEVEQIKDVVVEDRHIGKVIFFEKACPIVICGTGLLMIKKAHWMDGNGVLIEKWPKFRMKFK